MEQKLYRLLQRELNFIRTIGLILILIVLQSNQLYANCTPPVISETHTNVTCAGDSSGSIDISVSGNGPFNFLWSDGASDEDRSALNAGIYTLTVTDDSSCTASITITIAQPQPLDINFTLSHISCNGGQDGSIDLITGGGTAPYSYLWNNGSTQEDISNLSSGMHTVTVTDSLGCVLSMSFLLNQPASISAGEIISVPICAGDANGQIDLTPSGGTPPYSFIWSNSETTEDIANLVAGTYSVTIMDGNQCSFNFSFIVNDGFTPLPIVITPSSATEFCQGGSVILNASIGFTNYLWSTTEQTPTILVTNTGSYFVSAQDTNGCIANDSIYIDVFDLPFASVIVTDVDCFGNSTGSISASGLVGTPPFVFQLNNGPIDSIGLFTNLVAGLYDLMVTDSNACSFSMQVLVNEPPIISLTHIKSDNLCYNAASGSIDITVSGGLAPYTFIWSNGSTDEDQINLTNGNYIVTVTDANACVFVDAFDITSPTELTLGKDFNSITCHGGGDGNAIVFVSGGTPGYTYLWSDGQTTDLAESLDAGLYTVTVTDANGCTKSTAVLINEPPILSSQLNVSNVTCNGMDNGTASLLVSGGTPYQIGSAYIYSWNTVPVQTNSSANGLSAGSYIATISDSVGCILNVVANISEPNPILINITNINPTCNGGSNGQAIAAVSGGSAPYMYSWNTNPIKTTSNATQLSAGTYVVTVTDLNGCTKTATANLINPPAIQANATVLSVTCYGAADGKIILNPSGGTPPYSYLWNTNPAQTNATAQNLTPGNYTVTILGSGGCTQMYSYTITQPSEILCNPTVNNPTCFNYANGSIVLNPSGGVGPYTFIWSNGNTNSSLNNVVAGMYTVTITDASGCVKSCPFTLVSPAQLSITPSINHVSCFGGANANIVVAGSGGVSPYTYAWSNGSTGTSVSNLSAGNYTVTVTDANACTTSLLIQVTQPQELGCNCSANITHVSCYGGSNGSITANPTGGTPPYSYVWSNGQQTQTAGGLIAGTYTVTITDSKGCQSVKVIQVNEPLILNATLIGNDATCNSYKDGSAQVFPSGGTPPYTYTWSTIPVQTNATATGLGAGSYTVTIIDSKGCVKVAGVTIAENPAISCTINKTNVKCFGGSSGTASVTVGGGTAPFNYSWNTVPVKTTQTVIGLSAGTYTVTITDAIGCTKTSSVTIGQPSALLALYIATPPTCYGASNGSIDLIVTGGTQPYSFVWSNGATTEDISNIMAGLFQVTVTDSLNCVTNAVIVLNQPGQLMCSTNTSSVSCNGEQDGVAVVAASGGILPYSYIWSNGSTNASIINASAGTYTVTVTDANGCSSICQAIIGSPQSLSCSIQACCDTIRCYGDMTGALHANVTGGTAPYSYFWNSNPAQTGITASGLGAGTYTVIITDANGCTSSCSYTLTQPDPLTCLASGTNVTCSGAADGTATVIPTGGTAPYTYAWNTVVTQTTATAVGLSAGTYVVFVTDANNCTTSCSVTITEPSTLSCYINSNNVLCYGGNDGNASVVVLGGLPPYQYLWSNGQTNSTATDLVAGTYTVTVTDANGCSTSCSTIVSQGTEMSCSITSVDVLCFGQATGSATVTATGGVAPYSYSWNSIPPQFTQTATGLVAGTYIVIVHDAQGCTTSCTVTLTEPSQLTCSITVDKEINCYGAGGAEATAYASGGTPPYTYLWNTNPVQTTQTALGLFSQSYTVVITDAKGCTSSCSVTINQPMQLLCSTQKVDDLCGLGTGSASVNVSQGTPPYTFLWSNGATTMSIGMLTPGNYTVTVTDSLGCIAICDVYVAGAAPIIITTTVTHNTCYKGSDGQITANVSGGTLPYSFMWSNGQTTQTAVGLEKGWYTVTVTDANSCSATKSAFVNQPIKLNASFIKTRPKCYGESNGSIQAIPSGGTPPYTFLWSDGQTTAIAIGLVSAQYTVTITDANGCTKVKQPNLPNRPALYVTPIVTIPTCYGGNDGYITAQPIGGTPPYTYAWDDGQTTQTAVGLSYGLHTVTVTDKKGCTKVCTGFITNPPNMIVNILKTNVSCNGGNDGYACAHISSGGIPPFTYLWSDGQTTQHVYNLVAGTYTVTVTDSLGCFKEKTFNLGQPSALYCSITKTDPTCNASDGSLTVNVSGGSPGYLYQWSTGSYLPGISGLPSGTYTVTITDTKGCTTVCTETLVPTNSMACTICVTQHVTCYGGSDGSAQVCVAAGTAPYTFLWSNGQTNSSATGLSAGLYSITVTDVNGCISTCSIVINEPTQLICSTNKYDPTCGQNNGSATVSVVGGSAPYLYLWSNGQTNATATGLGQGLYTVTVTDANGCSTLCSATLIEFGSFNLSFSKIKNVSCHGLSNGEVEVNASGGNAPYSYVWSSGQTTQFISGLSAGVYTATVTDAIGCTAEASIQITQPDLLMASLTAVDVSISGNSDGSITSLVSGGTTPYSYLWSNGSTMASLQNLPAGTYTLTVTDYNLCITTSTAIVSEPVCSTFFTYAIEQWDDVPNGSNAGTYLDNNFATAFPNGIILGDCNRFLTLSSASVVRNFVASSGTPRQLDPGTLVDPTIYTYGNTLAGQLAALKLNMVFDSIDAGFAPLSTELFKNLKVTYGQFAGWTVEQVYNHAHYHLGCGNACNQNCFADINTAITLINVSYEEGIQKNNYLICPANYSPPRLAYYSDINRFELNAFPNPASEQISIEFISAVQQKFELQILNVVGQQISTETIGAVEGYNKVSKALLPLSNGTYVIRLIGSGEIGQFLFIKQ